MKGLRKCAQQRLLGIDIAEREVRLIEVVHGAESLGIKAMATSPLPELASAQDAGSYIEITGTAVRAAVQAAGAKASKAVIAISGTDMMLNEIEVPVEIEGEALETHVSTEAAECFPLPLEDMALDFIVLTPPERLATAGTMAVAELPSLKTKSVLMVACPTVLLAIRCETLANAGLEVVCVDVDIFALERTYAFLSRLLPKGDALGAVYLTPHAINLYLAAAGRIHLSAEIPHAFSPPAATTTDGALAVAESEPESWQQVDITTRIRTAAVAANLKLTHLLADGGASEQPDFVRQIETETGLKVPTIHPLTAQAAGCNLDPKQLERLTPKLVLACGLALRKGI